MKEVWLKLQFSTEINIDEISNEICSLLLPFNITMRNRVIEKLNGINQIGYICESKENNLDANAICNAIEKGKTLKYHVMDIAFR